MQVLEALETLQDHQVLDGGPAGVGKRTDRYWGKDHQRLEALEDHQVLQGGSSGAGGGRIEANLAVKGS